MAPAAWYIGFFDAAYVRLLAAEKARPETRTEVDFVVRALALRRKARVLDVPCGFGRHAAELARRGFEVTGVDLSAAMRAEARRRFGGRPRLQFERGDMRRLEFRAEFDAVINMFTSFGYFTPRENLEVLRRMARALRPGGRILVDHRDRLHDERNHRPRTWWRARDTLVLEESRFDVRRGCTRGRWILARRGEGRLLRRELLLYVYTLKQWRRMFRRVGLRLTAVYSGYDGRRFRPGAGPRLILVGERAA